MIVGIGCNIIEVARIDKAIRKEPFKNRVFSLNEQNYCESKRKQRSQRYAARFEATEAFYIGRASCRDKFGQVACA